MSTVTPDVVTRSGTGAGLAFALLSATSFGLAGPLGRGLLDSGWSAGAAVGVRVSVAAVVLLVPALLAMRGRWHLLRSSGHLVVAYGVAAVAGAQLCFFYAVTYLDVGVALLIEYTAPVAVVTWLWLRHGQRPGRLTLVGAVVAAAGLVLVLDVVGGARLELAGVLWGLGAMVGLSFYFLISADLDNGLPPIALAGGGLLVGATVIGLAGLLGLLPMAASTGPATYDGTEVPWWLTVLGLGLITAALAYVTGIAAGRRLGSRLASFVALSEVLMALVFAWLLLAELPGGWQLVGGALILIGVLLVRAGETEVAGTGPDLPAAPQLPPAEPLDETAGRR